MAKTLVGINPEILRWARERSGLTVEDVARVFNKESAAITAWESGGNAPTYVQLEKLAYQVYKRPIAIFFFPAPPDEPDRTREFRTLPEVEIENFSAETRYAIRQAEAMQLALQELNDGVNPSGRRIFRDIHASLSTSPQELAQWVRAYIDVSLDSQLAWSSTEEALASWRSSVEEAGIFVFKRPFKQGDISGFSLIDVEFPVVYLNNSTAFARQIFTLFHELAHILFETDGVMKKDDSYIDLLTGTPKQIEMFCNQFASELLVPSEDLEPLIRMGPYSDSYFEALADRYHVSREVILRKHLDRQLVERAFYVIKVEEWIKDYRRGGAGGGDYYRNQVAYLGDKFLGLVFGRYYQGRCSFEQLADYLNVKAQNIPTLEQYYVRKTTAT